MSRCLSHLHNLLLLSPNKINMARLSSTINQQSTRQPIPNFVPGGPPRSTIFPASARHNARTSACSLLIPCKPYIMLLMFWGLKRSRHSVIFSAKTTNTFRTSAISLLIACKPYKALLTPWGKYRHLLWVKIFKSVQWGVECVSDRGYIVKAKTRETRTEKKGYLREGLI